MKAKLLVYALPALLLATIQFAEAQQPTKAARIGFLIAASRFAISARTGAFLQGLRELGYVEGKNIVIEWRSSDGQLDRLPALAAELVHLNVEVIVTTGSGVTRAAKEATVTIPIVMTQDNDPVGNGFIASLARPDGNITGARPYLAVSRREHHLCRCVCERSFQPETFSAINASSFGPGGILSRAITSVDFVSAISATAAVRPHGLFVFRGSHPLLPSSGSGLTSEARFAGFAHP
jgi:ABC transporter substrate binding protein